MNMLILHFSRCFLQNKRMELSDSKNVNTVICGIVREY